MGLWEADDDYVVTIKPADCQRHIKKDIVEEAGLGGLGARDWGLGLGLGMGGPMHLGR